MVSWSGGYPPFLVMRSEAAEILDGVRLDWFAVDTEDRRFLDRTAATSDQRYYYRVYSKNSPPRVFAMQPAAPRSRDTVTLYGVGFGTECEDNHVMFISSPWIDVSVVEPCEPMQLGFSIPAVTGVGRIMVITPTGACEIGDADDHGSCFDHPPPKTW